MSAPSLTPELQVLLYTTILLLALVLLYGVAWSLRAGIPATLGNRENIPQSVEAGWIGRGRRAHLNLLENLVPFAIAVLVLRALNLSSPATVTAAYVFLGARLVHAAAYLLGIPGLRTLAWNVGLGATVVLILKCLI